MGKIRSFHLRKEQGIKGGTELCPRRMGLKVRALGGCSCFAAHTAVLAVPVLLSSALMHFPCISAGAHCSVPLGMLLRTHVLPTPQGQTPTLLSALRVSPTSSLTCCLPSPVSPAQGTWHIPGGLSRFLIPLQTSCLSAMAFAVPTLPSQPFHLPFLPFLHRCSTQRLGCRLRFYCVLKWVPIPSPSRTNMQPNLS